MPLFNLFISIMASAQMTTTPQVGYKQKLVFGDLATCKTYYTRMPAADKASVGTETQFCSDKIGSAVDLCLAEKINAFTRDTKIVFSTLTNSEQLTKTSKFKYECQVAEQSRISSANQADQRARDLAAAQQAAAAQQQAAAAQQQAAAGATGAAGGAQQAQAGLQAANQLLAVSDRIDAKVDKANGASGGAQPTGSAAAAGGSQTPSTAAAPATGRTDVPATTTATQPTQANGLNPQMSTDGVDGSTIIKQNRADGGQEVTTIGQDGTASRSTFTEQGELSGTETLSPEQTQKMVSEAQSAKATVSADSAALKPFGNEMAAKAEGVETAAQVEGGSSALAKTQITTSAQAVNSKITAESTALIQSANALATNVFLSISAGQINALTQQVQKYTNTTKTACMNAAENASFLCVEGTSPGAIAAKELMNAAGPIISIIGSAQKTCSATAKATKLVGTGLTIANGVCVASKLMCDGSCKAATADLASIQAAIQAAATQVTNEANFHRLESCVPPVAIASAPYCAALSAAHPKIMADLQKLAALLKPETSPAPMGTTGSLVAKCQSHVKDIVRFGIQILGTALAQKNAANCEKKLASSGNPSISAQQYCEKTENAATEWCKCKANNAAPGCPGAIVKPADPSKVTDSVNVAGTNVRGGAGNSAFAGGFKPTGPGAGSFGAANGLSSGLASASGSGDASTGKGGTGGGAGYGGGSASGGSGSASSNGQGGSDKRTAGAAAEKDKKWSFGALSNGGLGSFGSANSAKNAGKGGRLSDSEQAVQRRIASDQISTQVSAASGKSNWEKIKQRYLIQETTLLVGQ